MTSLKSKRMSFVGNCDFYRINAIEASVAILVFRASFGVLILVLLFGLTFMCEQRGLSDWLDFNQ
jgi:hypothetical protein